MLVVLLGLTGTGLLGVRSSSDFSRSSSSRSSLSCRQLPPSLLVPGLLATPVLDTLDTSPGPGLSTTQLATRPSCVCDRNSLPKLTRGWSSVGDDGAGSDSSSVSSSALFEVPSSSVTRSSPESEA